MTAGEELEGAVRELAAASFPAIYGEQLVSVLPEVPFRPVVMLARDHPAVRRFAAAAQSVDPYAQLAAAGEQGVFVQASVGVGWRMDLPELAADIVTTAARECLIAGETDSADQLAERGVATLAAVGRLLSGEQIDARAFVAFSGIALEEGGELELPWGTARNASPFEAQTRPFGTGGPTLVVEAKTPAAFRLGEPEDGAGFVDNEAQARLARARWLLPLAALLGVEREAYLAPRLEWQTVLVPAAKGMSYMGGPQEATVWYERFAQPVVLTSEEQSGFAEWSRLVDERHDPSIDIAIMRGLSAVRKRTSVEDALIDAAIGVENLFGHGGETEVGFRVTSAIAILLEDEPERRAAYASRLRKVYGSRSKVVHGGAPDPARLHEHKEEAIGVLVASLRKLLRCYPHLIPASDRGLRLLMRAEGESATAAGGAGPS